MTAPDANAADRALMLRVLGEHLEGGIAEFAADDLLDAGFVGPERVAAIEAETRRKERGKGYWRAVTRLIEAHRDEFDRLRSEEEAA